MTPTRMPGLPPVPRDHADASFSEVVPFRSSNIRLLKSPVFILFALLALVVPALFTLRVATMQQKTVEGLQDYFGWITSLTVFTMLSVTLIGVFVYARTTRSIWTYVYAAAGEFVVMLQPIALVYFTLFREILPGQKVEYGVGFFRQFMSALFRAGLCEELMKATPLLIAALIGRSVLRNGGTGTLRGIALRSPLDGVLMGMFSAAMFIFVETAWEYVPNALADVAKSTGDPYVGMLMALMLLIPRVLSGCVGHMAYSAIFGYFIGLAVIRPRQAFGLLVIGWVSAAVLHAAWNSVDEISDQMSYVVALLSAVGAAAVLLKARHIETTLYGAPGDSNGSVLVDRRPAAPTPFAAAAAFVPPAPPPPAPVQELPLVLTIDGMAFPVRGGMALDLGAEPALAGRGAGVLAQVVPHPTRAGVLGLRNTGTSGWTAWLRDGSTQQIERDQNVRLAPGTRIEFAPGLVGQITARG